MRRPDARSAYTDFSASTSEKVRQLSFAALGVIWVFRPTDGPQLPPNLVWAGILAICALAFDFLQSAYGTVAWGVLHRRKELAGLDDATEFKAPHQINWATNTFFAAKVVALAACYAILLTHLIAVVA